MRDQVAAVRQHLGQQPHTSESLATMFKRKPVDKVESVLDALISLGLVAERDGAFELLG